MASKSTKSWMEAAYERCFRRGYRQGTLTALRRVLRRLLELEFGTLPTDLVRTIERAEGVRRLHAAVERVVELRQALKDLDT